MSYTGKSLSTETNFFGHKPSSFGIIVEYENMNADDFLPISFREKV
jgi:hypothetical protein